jgi:hypothetical protein
MGQKNKTNKPLTTTKKQKQKPNKPNKKSNPFSTGEVHSLASRVANLARAIEGIRSEGSELTSAIGGIMSGSSMDEARAAVTGVTPMPADPSAAAGTDAGGSDDVCDGRDTSDAALEAARAEAASAGLDAESRSIKLFISSTFTDFFQERDIIVKFVIPKLRRLCRERDLTLSLTDLRWGITTRASSAALVHLMCLREVKR